MKGWRNIVNGILSIFTLLFFSTDYYFSLSILLFINIFLYIIIMGALVFTNKVLIIK